MSRQTSRIVWPSKPSTTRPSTSIRMRGVDCGRCGDWVSSNRSASAPRVVAGVVCLGLGGARLGAGERVGHQAPVAAVVGRLSGSKAEAKYRIPLVSGRVASRSWSHSAEATMSCARSVGELRVGGAQETRLAARHDLGQPAGADPAGDRLPARLVRAEAGQYADELEKIGAVIDERRAIRNRDGRRRREGRRSRRACPAASGGSNPPDGPPISRAWSERPSGSSPTELDQVAQWRAERHLRDAVLAGRAHLDEDGAGRTRGTGRAEGLRRPRG